MPIDVVEDNGLPLGGMEAVWSARILREGSSPGYGHREKQRIEARIVKALTEVAAGRHNTSMSLSSWGGRGSSELRNSMPSMHVSMATMVDLTMKSLGRLDPIA